MSPKVTDEGLENMELGIPARLRLNSSGKDTDPDLFGGRPPCNMEALLDFEAGAGRFLLAICRVTVWSSVCGNCSNSTWGKS